MTDEQKQLTAPYVPFRTFETALNLLASIGGIPPKIDHTVFPSIGGIAKGQVLSAFKYLGLVDANGLPQESLRQLALNKDQRKVLLKKIISQYYPNISESDLATMSIGQLDTKLGDSRYSASGATKEKVRAFLLKAASYCGITLSPLLIAKGPKGPRRKKTAQSGDGVKSPIDANDINPLLLTASVPSQKDRCIRMPIALGPSRLAYIELPSDWDSPKELNKLLSLLKISLSDQEISSM